jgi:crossover junction endodeoxyribonuclease RusA
MKVTLPWPPKILRPNGTRAHWGDIARAKASYKEICWALAKQSLRPISPEARPLIKLTFLPPTKRKHDLDNALASIKSGLDGVALALGCDDSRWRLQLEMADRIGGMVILEVTQWAVLP